MCGSVFAYCFRALSVASLAAARLKLHEPWLFRQLATDRPQLQVHR
jgi:hypothetical protein